MVGAFPLLPSPFLKVGEVGWKCEARSDLFGRRLSLLYMDPQKKTSIHFIDRVFFRG